MISALESGQKGEYADERIGEWGRALACVRARPCSRAAGLTGLLLSAEETSFRGTRLTKASRRSGSRR